MEISYSITDLYRRAFGHAPPRYSDVTLDEELIPGSNEPSMLGAEIRMPTYLRVSGEEWYKLPNEPIISLIGGKEVVITTLNRGRNESGNLVRGSVKEEINLEDYTISIRGLAVNETEDYYPDADMRQIRRLTEYPGAIEITNYLLNQIFNINLVVVKSMRYPRNEQLPFRAQAYEIGMWSDENFELELQ